MVRLLAVAVFTILQGSGLVVAYQWQDPVLDWMTGGHWLSPAVRVPLVVTGVVFAEILLLCACSPCHRIVAGVCGCHTEPAHGGSGRQVAATAR